MKVTILRNLGRPLQDKLGLSKKQREECCEGAEVDLDEGVAEALVQRRLAEVKGIKGVAKKPAIAEPKPEEKAITGDAIKGK